VVILPQCVFVKVETHVPQVLCPTKWKTDIPQLLFVFNCALQLLRHVSCSSLTCNLGHHYAPLCTLDEVALFYVPLCLFTLVHKHGV
jgi:hypothetical protein